MKIVPPGGLAGFSQMTNASKYALTAPTQGRAKSSALRMVRATKSRTGKKAKKRYAQNKRIAKGKTLKFGSPAWRKRFMKKKKK